MANLKDLIVNGSARVLGYLYANLKGNADTATKLETARTIRTNLGSTTAVGFDGSANVTPGIQGTLPVANGGTGQTSIANIQAGKDGDGNVISETYLKQVDQGNFLPNFDVMPVIATYTYNVATTTYQQLFTRTNTETAQIDLQDIVYCRITVTGTNINAKYDCAFIWKAAMSVATQMVVFSYPGTATDEQTGIRYLRSVFPKALNNGYDWIVDFQTYNTTARTIKVEVFKTNSKITWMSAATNTTYNSTGHNTNQLTLYTNRGLCTNDTILNGNVSQSSWSSSVNSYLCKYITLSTQPLTGAALLANQFTFMNGGKVYPATNKTLAIEPGFGILFNVNAYNNNVSIGWDRFREKSRVTSLTNIPHATLARGDACYFRCTMDSNGNILSDNYVTDTMTPGYTWYYVGLAESNTVICVDTTSSKFITLDSSGNLTAVDGKKIAGSNATSVTIRTW